MQSGSTSSGPKGWAPSKMQPVWCFQMNQGISRVSEDNPLRSGLGVESLTHRHHECREVVWSGGRQGMRNQDRSCARFFARMGRRWAGASWSPSPGCTRCNFGGVVDLSLQALHCPTSVLIRQPVEEFYFGGDSVSLTHLPGFISMQYFFYLQTCFLIMQNVLVCCTVL